MKTINFKNPQAEQKPKRNWKVKLIFWAILLIIALIIGWLLWPKSSSHDSSSDGGDNQKFASINGSMVSEAQSKLRPVAVVIENHSDSRPQSGYLDADIVYESLAEGGITRTLGIFQTNEPPSIGPVRSARPYFNAIADQWRAAYIHSGGSKQALSELNAGVYKNLFDVNEFFYGKYFERDSSRLAPHNLYTSMEKIRELMEDREEEAWEPVSVWKFAEIIPPVAEEQTTSITLPFSVKNYEVKYQFNPATKSYDRVIADKASIDRNTEAQISPKNILIQFADTNLNPDDDLGTLNIRLNNSGPCMLFVAGTRKDCRWSFANNKTTYTDLEGNELNLQPGQIWVEIFPRDRQNEITWK